jgi:hypothetical protein
MSATVLLSTEQRAAMIARTRLEYDPKVADELERLSDILNTPQFSPFSEAVVSEAKHQRFRWGDEADAQKTAWDWFWTLGYLGGKAAHAALVGDLEKAKHHTITAAAMCANWYRHICAVEGTTP